MSAIEVSTIRNGTEDTTCSPRYDGETRNDMHAEHKTNICTIINICLKRLTNPPPLALKRLLATSTPERLHFKLTKKYLHSCRVWSEFIIDSCYVLKLILEHNKNNKARCHNKPFNWHNKVRHCIHYLDYTDDTNNKPVSQQSIYCYKHVANILTIKRVIKLTHIVVYNLPYLNRPFGQ